AVALQRGHAVVAIEGEIALLGTAAVTLGAVLPKERQQHLLEAVARLGDRKARPGRRRHGRLQEAHAYQQADQQSHTGKAALTESPRRRDGWLQVHRQI